MHRHHLQTRNLLTVIAAITLTLLSSCAPRITIPHQPYRPPVSAGDMVPATSTAIIIQSQPTAPIAKPDCQNNLTYIEDLSIPDGSTIASGSIIEKLWQVENSGTCHWNQSYRLRLISGDSMGLPIETTLYPARAGTQFALHLRLIAPAAPGSYLSVWQAISPEGLPFGDAIYLQVHIQEE